MFLLSLALLVVEITTTRMLSVAMAYHCAVLSISLAMLGLAVGGVFVYLNPSLLARHGALRVAANAGTLSGVAIPVALLCFFGLPLRPVPALPGLMNLFLLATGLVLAVGLALGTLFPMGVRALTAAGKGWGIAWCWAANGAASVLGSVLGLILGTEAGMRITFLTGASLYLTAAVLARSLRKPQDLSQTEAGAAAGLA